MIAAASDAQQMVRSEPPGRFVMLGWLTAFLVGAWFCINGRMAESVHRSWNGTWLLPGVMSDLPTLKRIYRWLGILMLVLILVMCVAGIVDRLHAPTPNI